MQGGAGLDLPYVDDAKLHHPARAMDVPAACGHPDGRPDPLRPGRPRSFRDHSLRLDRANEAVAHAAAHSGPFKMTVIEPR
jgi:alcohol dehydrogenase